MLRKSATLSVLFLLVAAAVPVSAQVRSRVDPSTEGVLSVKPLVTATVSKEQVRLTVLALTQKIRLEVLSQTGEPLYDSDFHPGNRLEWQVRDQHGSELRDGIYGCIVTVEDLDGQMSHRRGILTVANGVVSFDTLKRQGSPSEEQESLTILSPEEPPPFTLVSHDGKEGWIESASGGLSFYAGSLSRSRDAVPHLRLTTEGNLGIGVEEPQAKLEVAGLIRASEGFQFSDGTVLKMENGQPILVNEIGSGNMGGSAVLGVNTTRVLATGGRIGVLDAGAGGPGKVYASEGGDPYYNTLYGLYAGGVLTTGQGNSFFGYVAGNSNTAGSGNSFFGRMAGYLNTTGGGNSFFGQESGTSNNGAYNSSFGFQAGNQNSSGNYNLFVGMHSGESNTSENYNSFIGTFSDGAVGITNATAVGYRAKVTQSNSLVLGSINGVNGATASTNVGIGTTAPALLLHMTNGDTPALRMEQTAGTFTAQTWDVAGNEANFFVRDLTHSSRLPFRIRPNAPTSSIDISASGNVGVGTAAPQQKLHVQGGLYASGNVGIGTTNPVALLDVEAPAQAGAESVAKFTVSDGAASYIAILNGGSTDGYFFPEMSWRAAGTIENYFVATGETDSGGNSIMVFDSRIGNTPAATRPLFDFRTFGSSVMKIKANGNVGIGIADPQAKLHVNGNILATGTITAQFASSVAEIPDYVFEPGYKLMPVEELGRFVEKERHLPNVPAATEIKEKGLNLGEFQMRLLEKIEELTLYTVEQAKTIKEKDAEVAALSARLAALEQTMERLAKNEGRK